ncbi:MAG: protein kinase [Phycisphaerae bacterium]
MNCDDARDRLLEYVEGDLDSDAAAHVRQHVRACAECKVRLSDLRRIVGALDDALSLDEHCAANESAPPRGDDEREPRGAARPNTGDRWAKTRPLDDPADPRCAPTPVAPPARVVGDFEILDEIGRGGMGVVYRARQISLNRVVALKLLGANLGGSERTITRFLREAQAAARLHHTNIVPVYAQGHEHGCFYYAMELIDGAPLSAVLAADPVRLRLPDAPPEIVESAPSPRASANAPDAPAAAGTAVSGLRRGASGRVSTRRTADHKRIARLIAEAADALHHAHQQGIVHRDVKPQNMLLGRDDKLHVTDFGLARVLDEAGMTMTSEILGTPSYMAPEQITGDRNAIDARTDVFALGATLYELLTGRRPFVGESYDQVIHAILHRDPPSPRSVAPHIPLDLETICLRALEKEPRRRFASALDLSRDLRRYAEDFPISSRRVGPLGKAVRWVRRHPARATSGAALALLVVLLPVLWHFVNVSAASRIDAAWRVLIDDYRNSEPALAQLGWAARLGGDRARCALVRALATIRTDARQAIDLLPRAPRGSRAVETEYLRAWARNWDAAGYEQVLAALQHGDALIEAGSATTPEAWFFKGQALIETDPAAARYAFEQAIVEANRGGWTFLQAMEHKGRAINYAMYLSARVEREQYDEAVASLRFAAQLKPTRAFPRYLLATTHWLAAQSFQRAGVDTEAETAFAFCQQAAGEARAAEPTSARGYAAEAFYHEARGDFAAAIDWWNRIAPPTVIVRPYDREERDRYAMRLYFALGDIERAAERCRALHPDADGRDVNHDPDAAFVAALLAREARGVPAAAARLERGARAADGDVEWLLRLEAARRLCGVEAAVLPADARALRFEPPLSPKWSRPWSEALYGYVRGQSTWEALLDETLDARTCRPDDRQFLLSAAWFQRGIASLCAGDRTAALRELTAAADAHDNENYCYLARFLMYRMERDPRWPPWLAPTRNDAASSATPAAGP